MAFDGTELGAKSTLSITVHSMEEGVGAWLLPQVAQLSAFGHFWSAAQFWRFRAFSGVFRRARIAVLGRFREFFGRQLSASGSGVRYGTTLCFESCHRARLPEFVTGVCYRSLLLAFATGICYRKLLSECAPVA